MKTNTKSEKIDKGDGIVIPSNTVEVKKLFGHLIPYNFIEIPKEHRWRPNRPHSLRCFKKVWQRDEEHNPIKTLPRVRCKRHVAEGYLYCTKHGGNYKNLPAPMDDDKKSSSVAMSYKKIYDAELSDLLETFLNDPNILDLKPDLANLRVVLNAYIKKIVEKPHRGTVLNFTTRVREVLMEEEKSEEWKYNKIIEIVEGMNSLTSGKCIDRIYRCVDHIGRLIERIHKVETNNSFMLTPDGVKVILRAIVDILNTNIEDKTLIGSIREQLLSLSIETQGELSRYGEVKQKPVKYDAEAEIVENK